MKLAKIMLIALTLSAFGIYLTSCSQSDILETATENTIEQSSHEFKLSEYGWLHFESEAALDAAKKEVLEYMQNGNLDEFEKKYGHKSLHTAYWETIDKLTEAEMIEMGTQRQVFDKYKDIFTFVGEGEDTEAVRIIESDLLATLLNEKGIYQIGDEIHKYNYDVVKIINDGDVDKLTALEDMNSSNPSLNIVIEPHNHNRTFVSNNNGDITMRMCGNTGTQDFNGPNKRSRRVQGRLIVDELGGTGSFTITVSARKQRRFVFWFDNNWSGWVESKTTDFRVWPSFFVAGNNDIIFLPGERVKG